MNRATSRRIRGVVLLVLLLDVCGTISAGLTEGSGARVAPAEGTPGAEVYLPPAGRGYPVTLAQVTHVVDGLY